MGYHANIKATIDGISKESFELIKDFLMDTFSEVSWFEEFGTRKNVVVIESYEKHDVNRVDEAVRKLAFCIDKGTSEFYEHNLDDDDYWVGYLRFNEVKWFKGEVTYPPNPFDEARS